LSLRFKLTTKLD